jgi:type II secretory pathway pseudopilin PulG
MLVRNRRQSVLGFTLLETMVATAVLAFGVLALAAMLANGLAYMHSSQDDFIAHQKAEEAVEGIFAARDTAQVTWADIQNVQGGVGVFLPGPQPLLAPGPNGVVGTAQDQANNPDCIILPGADGIMGTADDVRVPLSNFQRTITITNVAGNPNLRTIQVVITYNTGQLQRTYQLTTYISAFS